MGYDFKYPFLLAKVTVQQYIKKQKKILELKKQYQQVFRDKKRKNRKTVYLVMTPEHENYGDHAIALAETEFLQKHGVDYVEITGYSLEVLRNYGLLSIMNGSPIVFQGGGYLGTLWFESEVLLRQVIQENPKSPIILLPNTIYYEGNDWGAEEFEKSVAVYGAHKNLHIYAREKQSYERMKTAYKNVKLIPDMVFSLDAAALQEVRSGCILSLRADMEKTRTQEQDAMILQQVSSLFGENVRRSDMVSASWIPVSQRKKAVYEKFREFSGAELVVTDRLHGMIFCVVTGTPCVVLDSKSPKVRGCYEWVKGLNYIRFADDASQIIQAYESIQQTRDADVYDNSVFSDAFEELAEDMEAVFRWR